MFACDAGLHGTATNPTGWIPIDLLESRIEQALKLRPFYENGSKKIVADQCKRLTFIVVNHGKGRAYASPSGEHVISVMQRYLDGSSAHSQSRSLPARTHQAVTSVPQPAASEPARQAVPAEAARSVVHDHGMQSPGPVEVHGQGSPTSRPRPLTVSHEEMQQYKTVTLGYHKVKEECEQLRKRARELEGEVVQATRTKLAALNQLKTLRPAYDKLWHDHFTQQQQQQQQPVHLAITVHDLAPDSDMGSRLFPDTVPDTVPDTTPDAVMESVSDIALDSLPDTTRDSPLHPQPPAGVECDLIGSEYGSAEACWCDATGAYGRKWPKASPWTCGACYQARRYRLKQQ